MARINLGSGKYRPWPQPPAVFPVVALPLVLHPRKTPVNHDPAPVNLSALSDAKFHAQLLQGLNQELRVSITSIKTALTLLDTPALKPPGRQRYMSVLFQECDRQSALVGRLQELMAMGEPALPAGQDLEEILPGILSTYQPLASERGVLLAYTIAPHLPLAACPASWLKQVLVQLLENSLKFTQPGGRVWLRVRPQGEYLELEFRDTGIGIPASDLPHIFAPFYRVHRTCEGVGLGLTIVQQCLEGCGGTIAVKSKLHEGSLFTVLLPVVPS